MMNIGKFKIVQAYDRGKNNYYYYEQRVKNY